MLSSSSPNKKTPDLFAVKTLRACIFIVSCTQLLHPCHSLPKTCADYISVSDLCSSSNNNSYMISVVRMHNSDIQTSSAIRPSPLRRAHAFALHGHSPLAKSREPLLASTALSHSRRLCCAAWSKWLLQPLLLCHLSSPLSTHNGLLEQYQ